MIYWLIRIYAALLDPSELFACDPAEGPRIHWTRTQREGARQLAYQHLKAKGARRPFLVFMDVAAIRETGARPSRRHDANTGLGMHGMNERYHGAGRNLCDPRDSADAGRELARRCITRHGVSNLWELQACYAGRFECTPRGDGTCTAQQQDRTTSAICSRIGAYNVGCFDPISLRDLGEP